VTLTGGSGSPERAKDCPFGGAPPGARSHTLLRGSGAPPGLRRPAAPTPAPPYRPCRSTYLSPGRSARLERMSRAGRIGGGCLLIAVGGSIALFTGAILLLASAFGSDNWWAPVITVAVFVAGVAAVVVGIRLLFYDAYLARAEQPEARDSRGTVRASVVRP
jgi:putative superfamily III holin-X